MAETQRARGLPRAVVDDVYLAPVHLNVGGTTYTTTLTTLTKFPDSKLAKLFDGTLAITVDPVHQHYFLDVDGSVFTHILNFLRYEKLVLPEGFSQLPLLKEQAEFFELEAMLTALTTKDEIEGESGTEEDNVRHRRRRRRRRSRDKKEQEGGGEETVIAEEEGKTGGEEAVIAEKEGETAGGSEVVFMDVSCFNDKYSISLYSSAKLPLEEPLPQYENLKSVSDGVGHRIEYNFMDTYNQNLPNILYFTPCVSYLCKQLFDKGYKITAVARLNSGYNLNQYVFTRVK